MKDFMELQLEVLRYEQMVERREDKIKQLQSIIDSQDPNDLHRFRCWHCDCELIWGGDHDTEDNEDYDIVSNLSCPKCHSAVDVWHPSEKLIKEYKDYEKEKK